MGHHKHLHRRKHDVAAQVAELEARKATPQTVISVVYTTAAPTFDGPVAGYTTLGPAVDTAQDESRAQPTPQLVTSVAISVVQGGGLLAHSPLATSHQSFLQTKQSVSSATPTKASSSSPTSLSSVSNSAASSIIAPTSSPPSNAGGAEAFNPVTTSSDPPASATSSANGGSSLGIVPAADGGTSTGAKAGIAFAVLLALACLAAVGFCLYRKKKAAKNKAYGKTLDEKRGVDYDRFNPQFGGAAPRSSSPPLDAPRLELRPVTQFDPNLTGAQRSVTGPLSSPLASSAGGAASLDLQRSPASPTSPRVPVNGAAPSRMNDPANPFGSHAEASNHLAPGFNPNTSGPSRPITPFPSTPADNAPVAAFAAVGGSRPSTPRVQAPGSEPTRELVAAVPAQAMSSSSSPRVLRDHSPTASEYSSMSMPGSPAQMAGAAAGGPGASPVHRVQLDFKPSMDDELGLQAGQLVRLLHEYDDGWALCMRMDRSQQGVAPRTCLSTRAVKPRPSNGPRGGPPPGMRGPNGPGPGRPMGRPMSPAGGRNSPGPRMRQGPPGDGRQSPSPYGAPPPEAGMSPSYTFPAAPGPLSSGRRPRNSSDPFARPPGGGRSMSPAGHRPRSNSGSQLAPQGGRLPAGPSRMNPNASGSPPMQHSTRNQYSPHEAPMGLNDMGGRTPHYNTGPASAPGSPPNSSRNVARKPAPGQAM